jgi:hypothetical protein
VYLEEFAKDESVSKWKNHHDAKLWLSVKGIGAHSILSLRPPPIARSFLSILSPQPAIPS